MVVLLDAFSGSFALFESVPFVVIPSPSFVAPTVAPCVTPFDATVVASVIGSFVAPLGAPLAPASVV